MQHIAVPLFDLKVNNNLLRKDLAFAFLKVLKSGKLFMGPEVEEFENEIKKTIGSLYAVGVGSGSSALYLALKACDIKHGDEVITTPLTWIITVNAIAACGATPVFADINEDLNLDPASIEKKITTRTRAIVPMHYAGHMCDMKAICQIAKRYELKIIEDAAQAFGASLEGKCAGTFSAAGAFSMNPMKVLGGYGEAGVVVTDHEDIYLRLKRLRHAGTTSDPKKKITNECFEVSLNHKMDTINAACLLVALKQFSEKKRKRELVAKKFDTELPFCVKKQICFDGEVHGRYVYPIRSKKRNLLKEHLEKLNIETKIFNQPLACDAPVYRYLKKAHVPNARKLLKEILILPSHEKLTIIQQDHIVNSVKSFFNK